MGQRSATGRRTADPVSLSRRGWVRSPDRVESQAFHHGPLPRPCAPRIDIDTWRLHIDGLVERPLELSYTDLLLHDIESAMLPERQYAPPSTQWSDPHGVALVDLLAAARIDRHASVIVAHSASGCRTYVPLHTRLGGVAAGEIVLGYGGEPLQYTAGFPAILVVRSGISEVVSEIGRASCRERVCMLV